MKRMFAALAAGVLIGVIAAANARLPPVPPKTDEQKAAEAQKAAAEKARDADQLGKAQDRAVANYKKNAAAMDDRKK
jgi:hypothetical protein